MKIQLGYVYVAGGRLAPAYLWIHILGRWHVALRLSNYLNVCCPNHFYYWKMP